MKTVLAMSLVLLVAAGSFILGQRTAPTQKIIEQPKQVRSNIDALIEYERTVCHNEIAGTDQWYAAGGHLTGMGWVELEQYLAWAEAERKAGTQPPMGSKGWDQEIANVTTEMYDRLTEGEYSRGGCFTKPKE